MPSRSFQLPVVASSARGASHDFTGHLLQNGRQRLRRRRTTTLQVNVGKLCNMSCQHCHVEAGPKRTESMTESVARRVVELIRGNPSLDVVDLTGGAPELNPNFRFMVREAHALGRQVIDRSNLSVLFEEGQRDLPDFLAGHRVRIVASLPCYQRDNVDHQRGKGAFDRSIRAIQRLNEIGYGRSGSGLLLDLVYNPTGPFLPPAQAELERVYRHELFERFGLSFNHLLTITNMPIRRFLHALERDGEYSDYMDLLVRSFNAGTLSDLMCRRTLSVSWDGQLYDCDFNQMLELGVLAQPRTIWDLESITELDDSSIATGSHCFGCTAGAGSSCGGALDG